jgi:hypothetical protein
LRQVNRASAMLAVECDNAAGGDINA